MQNHAKFISDILAVNHYADKDRRIPRDDKVTRLVSTSSQDYILFEVGDGPTIPSECQYFLRFSATLSGPITDRAEPYIRKVCDIAQKYFPERAVYWTEGYAGKPLYEWDEVVEAQRAFVLYEERDKRAEMMNRLEEDMKGKGGSGSKRKASDGDLKVTTSG